VIATQPGSIACELFQIASNVPEHRRDAVLKDINGIIDTNWLTEETFWSREHSPFQPDHGVVLLHHGGECVAYLIIQRLAVAGTPVIYLSGTAVKYAYRGSGFFRVARNAEASCRQFRPGRAAPILMVSASCWLQPYIPSSPSRQRRWRCAGPMASFAIAKSRGRKPRPISTAGLLRPSRTAPMRCSAPDGRTIAGRSAEQSWLVNV